MATRGMYIFEAEQSTAVYVHYDNYPEGAANKLAEWCSFDNPTVDMFVQANNGEYIDECEHDHGIEYRYRIMYPTLLIGERTESEVIKELGQAQVPDALAMILVQHRKMKDNIDWENPPDNVWEPYVTEYCGPMFAFIEKCSTEHKNVRPWVVSTEPEVKPH